MKILVWRVVMLLYELAEA